MDLLIATGNPGKLREYQALLADAPVRLLSLNDVGLAGMDVAENADTLAGNATLKAQAYAQASGLIALGDDTGLFVDELNGAPGIYAARYGGHELTMAQKRQKLLAELGDTQDARRTARFKCVIALAYDDLVETVEGVCDGHIAWADAEGSAGFGYDAVFIAEGYDVPWSQVPPEVKNRISHRGQAARQIIPILWRLAAEN